MVVSSQEAKSAEKSIIDYATALLVQQRDRV